MLILQIIFNGSVVCENITKPGCGKRMPFGVSYDANHFGLPHLTIQKVKEEKKIVG